MLRKKIADNSTACVFVVGKYLIWNLPFATKWEKLLVFNSIFKIRPT